MERERGDRMKNIKRLIGAMLVLSLFLVGCSGNDDQDSDAPNDTETEVTEEEVDLRPSFEEDKDVQEEIEANENVEQAVIQLDTTGDKDAVNVDIMMTTDEDVEKEADKFADQIREAYPDHVIDMIIVYDDNVIHKEQYE